MKIFANQKIKLLFGNILLCILIFAAVSVLLIGFKIRNAAFFVLVCSMCMSIIILVLCYRYFKEQNKIMETAASKIAEYISGNKNARIECDHEGGTIQTVS